MAPLNKNRRNSRTTKDSSKKREINVYTRRKCKGNLRVREVRAPVRFENANKSVLRMLEANSRSSSPDEINMRLRGCRLGTPFRPIVPSDGETDQTEVNDRHNLENMLNQIVELQLRAARLQGQTSLSKIVHKAIDYGVKNGVILKSGESGREEKGQWCQESSHSSTSESPQRPKCCCSKNDEPVSAGRSFFRVGQAIGKLFTYLRPRIAVFINNSTVLQDVSTQCNLPDISASQSKLKGGGTSRRNAIGAVSDRYRKPDPLTLAHETSWNTSCERCSTDTSSETVDIVNRSSLSEDSEYRAASERTINIDANFQPEYAAPSTSPVNNHPHQCFNSRMMDNYDLFIYGQCTNTPNERRRE